MVLHQMGGSSARHQIFQKFSWITTFENTQSFISTTGFYGYTFRLAYNANTFSESGTKVRFTFRRGSGNSYIGGMYIGIKGGGANFDGAPTQITVGNQGSFTISSDNTLSDEIDFTLDKTNAHLISFCVNNSGVRTIAYVNTGYGPDFVYRRYTGTGCDASTITGSGYSGYNAYQYLFDKIEVWA